MQERRDVMLKHLSAFLIKAVLTLTVITGLFGAFTIATQRETGDLYEIIDRYNIFVDWQPLYVKTQQSQGEPTDSGGYQYTQVAYTADGALQDVRYYTSEKLANNHYLKLTAKGRYVESYEEIKKSSLPTQALDRLNG